MQEFVTPVNSFSEDCEALLNFTLVEKVQLNLKSK